MAKYRVPVLHSFGWQEAVLDKDITAAPASPSKGDRYLVPKEGIEAGDAWEGAENKIAWYDGESWNFDTPENGWHVYVQDEKLDYIFDGENWGSTPTSVDVFVDVNRTDTYSPTGSNNLPYKTIQDALDHIINEADNTLDKGYSVNIAPGSYSETLSLDSTTFINIMLKGESPAVTFIGETNAEFALNSISNNTQLLRLNIQGITFVEDVIFSGDSAGNNFGKEYLTFADCIFEKDLTLKACCTPTLQDSQVDGTLTYQNVGEAILAGSNSVIDTCVIRADDSDISGACVDETYTSTVLVFTATIDNLTFETVNDSKALLFGGRGASISSETAIIPSNVTVSLYNSCLVDDWTVNGSLYLNAGSYVTGTLTEGDDCTLDLTGQKSSQISIGVVPDGDQLSDGIIPLPAENKVSWALDEFNEIIRDMAPAEPDELTDVVLANSITVYSGKLPSGLDARWYPTGTEAGDTVSVIKANELVLSSGEGDPDSYETPTNVPWVATTTNAARFRQGNAGTLQVKHADGVIDQSVVCTLDIEANFVENVAGSRPRYPDEQDLNLWDSTGDGDACENGIVNLTNSKGSLEVTYVGTFNDFPLWQKMNAQINVSNLDEGYNAFSLLHAMDAGDEESAVTKLFYDDSSDALAFTTSPTIVENTINSSKYISGVRYYSTGDTFDVNYVGANVYQKVYRTSYVSMFRFEALSSNQNRNPASIPVYTDQITINETIAINRSNYHDLDTRLSAYLYHPWKSTKSATTASENRMVCTYGDTLATDTADSTTGEEYRLPDGTYDTIPEAITGQWDSTKTLENGQALRYNLKIQYPNIDLTSNLPAENPDYSTGFSGGQTYLRAFRDTADPHSSITITMSGITNGDISPVGSTSGMTVEIKLPTQTGWLDCGTAFNSATFTGADGDGCKASVSGEAWTFTFGTFSTANSGNMVIVRLTFYDSSQAVGVTFKCDW